MTVSEAITKSGITPSASYTGIETANDFVLAFQIESTQTKESQWIVCADHVKEHSGSPERHHRGCSVHPYRQRHRKDRHPAHPYRQRRPLRGR